MKKFVSAICVFCMLFLLASCEADKPDIPKGITKAIANITNAIDQITDTTGKVVLTPLGKEDDEDSMKGPLGERINNKNVADATADFGFELFGYALESDGNALISPVSVMAALAMTADGANGQTLAEMENVLGMTNENLRKDYGGYVHPANSDEQLRFANSLWLRNDGKLQVNKNFVDRTVTAYGADVFSEPFNNSTCRKINYWISENTDGEIKNMLSEIPESTVSYIINTVLFEAEWQNPYTGGGVRKNQSFTNANGSKTQVTMLASGEYGLVELGKTKGFIKRYAECDYAFVGLLPDEGVSVSNALASFTGQDFIDAVNNPTPMKVVVNIPKFDLECKFELNDALSAMGMPTAFSSAADFTNLGVSPLGNIYLSKVMHNTFIRYDEKGTKAGAATVVAFDGESAPVEIEYLTFDRPFIYAIIDTSSGTPIFIGAVQNL